MSAGLVNKPEDLRPCILFVTPATPFCPRSGAEQRSALMYEALSDIGDVDILVLADGAPSPPRMTTLPHGRVMVQAQKEGARGFTRFDADAGFTHLIKAVLPRGLHEYHLVVGRYLWPISQLVVPANVPMIVDLDDFKYRYSSEAGFSARILLERIKKTFSHWLAGRQLHKFAGAFVVNALDQQDIGELPARFLPNIPYGKPMEAFAQPAASGKELLFVGSLWYRPNADGVNWFLKHVWPVVKRAIPESKLTLIGAAPTAVRTRWEKYQGVTAPGFVDNLHDAYQKAALVIVPIHIGGGSNIKVLEALGHARPCIVTRLTASAFNGQLHHAEHFLVAETARQFGDWVIEVLQHPQAYQAMSTQGYHAVRSGFSNTRFKAEVIRFVRERLN